MKRALLALVLIAGCAAPAASAPADSVTIRFHAPSHGALSCDAPDTTRPLRDAVRVIVMRLKGQPPFYRPGCEFNAACWDSVVRYGEPDTLWQAWAVPGAACSLRVARGAQYVPRVRGQACGAWKVLVVQ